MADEATTSASEAETKPGATPSGGRDASELREIADALRSRLDLFGKAIAAVATLGTSAVGLEKIGELFPADGELGWGIVACIALLITAVSAIGVAVLLMRVARPVFLHPKLESSPDLDGSAEHDEVAPIYEAAAQRFGYSSLYWLQERERALRNAAARATDEDERARRTALADDVKNEIEQALARAQVAVVRYRASKAVSGGLAWTLYLGFLVGLIVFAVGTDLVSNDDRDRIADAKACGEARTAKATDDELERAAPICEAAAEEPAAEPDSPSAAVARAQIGKALMDALSACTELVGAEGDAEKGGPLKNEDCNPVRTAVAEIDPAVPVPAAPNKKK